MDNADEGRHSAAFAAQDTDQMEEPPRRSDPEHLKAKWWREHVVQLSRREVAELTDMPVSRIADIEQGKNRSTGTPIDAATMKRYRMACAAVTLGVDFDFLSLRMIPEAAIEIRMWQGSGRNQ